MIVTINNKAYTYAVGMGLIHYLANLYKTDSLYEVVSKFQNLQDNQGGLKISAFKTIGELVRGAVITGSGEDVGDLEEWVLKNMPESIEVMKGFFDSLPKFEGEKKKETES